MKNKGPALGFWFTPFRAPMLPPGVGPLRFVGVA